MYEDILDYIEERAFCEGYEQRMFDEKVENLTDNQKLAIAAAIGAGSAGAGMYGLSKVEGRGKVARGLSSVRNSKLGKLVHAEESMGTRAKNYISDSAADMGKKIKKLSKGEKAAIIAGAAGLAAGGTKLYQHYKDQD